jgi:hypothetical protein
VSYNVHCGHNKRIFHVGPIFPGSTNDMTMVKADTFVSRVRDPNGVYASFVYDMLYADGSSYKTKGCWHLCEGGYHQWRTTICGLKDGLSDAEKRFSKRAESVRKDIECVFGRLKMRFGVLRLPMLAQSADLIDDQFRTCCVLHNMLLHIDGLDTIGKYETD